MRQDLTGHIDIVYVLSIFTGHLYNTLFDMFFTFETQNLIIS